MALVEEARVNSAVAQQRYFGEQVQLDCYPHEHIAADQTNCLFTMSGLSKSQTTQMPMTVSQLLALLCDIKIMHLKHIACTL